MRLLRQVAAGENLYNALKVRYEQVSLAEAEASPDLTVLDAAVAPLGPTSNDGPRLLLLASLASLGLAIALALLHDRLDRTFRYPDQATLELRLPIAGSVPRFKSNRHGKFDLPTMSRAVESFRSLRLAVRFAFPPDTPIVLSVASPGAGDGKSLVSSNLALAFASAGHRTLLIDGDVRCGTQHRTFDVPITPGLVDYLHAAVDIKDVVKSTASDNLYLLPSGSRESRAPELLVSDRMMALVADMGRRFEVVIIDSPPFVAGMDAYAIGAAAGSMLIVLRPAVTDRKLAAAKLEIVDRLPIRVLGSVLNSVSDGGIYRYYGSHYGPGHETPLGPGGNVATPKGLELSA
jgi:capsular exopolysaccharide synthesis family protein